MLDNIRAAGRSVVMAFSLFSRIPMPPIDWDKANMRYLMSVFPLVGVVIGAAMCAWCALCGALGLGGLARGAGLALLPVALTGGIHLDGMADVADALASHAEPERKLQIMKDPHMGPFAALALTGTLLALAALGSEVEPEGWRGYLLLLLLPAASRCAGGLATLLFPSASKGGMQETFRTAAGKRAPTLALAGVSVLAAAGLVAADPLAGGAMVLACAACAWAARRRAVREFGGFNGDQAGFLVCSCEVALMACLALLGKAVAL